MNMSDDLLTGAKAIGGFIGKTERQAFYMLEKKQIPGFKTGKTWNARKTSILEHFARLEREANQAA
ncbi:DNA-binding protein [Bradyrhizobium sp. 23]|uniref:DNA-binding protein n=1 Tax=Bradyrhizobium sp. 23 TaxID=2782667 RepID=UPI001FF7773A|nr:DNA-binding protein [Bradyrhizobium sp. 23]MCK1317136.1 DNA-binding protein [Bradyrhizobium sp. 23]